jgi:hypothetical protein
MRGWFESCPSHKFHPAQKTQRFAVVRHSAERMHTTLCTLSHDFSSNFRSKSRKKQPGSWRQMMTLPKKSLDIIS